MDYTAGVTAPDAYFGECAGYLFTVNSGDGKRETAVTHGIPTVSDDPRDVLLKWRALHALSSDHTPPIHGFNEFHKPHDDRGNNGTEEVETSAIASPRYG